MNKVLKLFLIANFYAAAPLKDSPLGCVDRALSYISKQSDLRTV
jgi:hypothetical protein